MLGLVDNGVNERMMINMADALQNAGQSMLIIPLQDARSYTLISLIVLVYP